jgi:acetylornithine deacetylase/succinyl-diaminopimelate desuccinylase-like protein
MKMTDQRVQAVEYAHRNRQKFLDNLKHLVAIPSISTSPDHIDEMVNAAQWIAGQLEALGMEDVQVYPTGGHPVVYGQWLDAGPQAPTMLVYGHYDVQPVEPLELWESDPFEPTERGENLYGRGASDMKGQVMAALSAVESVQSQGPLPVNVKFIIEGEEEIGSPNLTSFLETHKDLLASDFALNPDAGMIGPGIPTIIYALRGLAYFELRVYGPSHDLHSGIYGGVIHNPAQALCELIAGMHDENGRITLPGFYDSVRPLSQQERSELGRLPMDEDYYRQQTGASQTYGEAGYTTTERVGGRPTLDVNGMLSGFTGKGSKTVIPAYAMAKISMRLVPDQDPAEVEQQLRRYLEEKAPPTVRWEISTMSGGPASMSDPNLPATQALADALEQVWGVRPLYKREGGSVPVVADMQKILGVESVLTGFGLPDDNLHAPNEKLHLPTWYSGIDALVNFFYNLQTSR